MDNNNWTIFSAIDWASERHAVSVLDDAGRTRRTTIDHSRNGFDRLVRWLARIGDPADLPVAIERPDGRLVDRLLGWPSGRAGQDQRHQGLARSRGDLGCEVRRR